MSHRSYSWLTSTFSAFSMNLRILAIACSSIAFAGTIVIYGLGSVASDISAMVLAGVVALLLAEQRGLVVFGPDPGVRLPTTR